MQRDKLINVGVCRLLRWPIIPVKYTDLLHCLWGMKRHSEKYIDLLR